MPGHMPVIFSDEYSRYTKDGSNCPSHAELQTKRHRGKIEIDVCLLNICVARINIARRLECSALLLASCLCDR